MTIEDINIPPLSSGQMVGAMAFMVCNQINAMVENVSNKEERTKMAQCYFTIFVPLLRICADEMDAKAKEASP